MSNAIFYCAFKLKKGVATADFLEAAKNLNDGYISKQKGYVGWKQVYDEKSKTWADLLTFETMEDAKNFEKFSNANPNDLSKKFYSFIRLLTCKMHFYSLEKEYTCK